MRSGSITSSSSVYSSEEDADWEADSTFVRGKKQVTWGPVEIVEYNEPPCDDTDEIDDEQNSEETDNASDDTDGAVVSGQQRRSVTCVLRGLITTLTRAVCPRREHRIIATSNSRSRTIASILRKDTVAPDATLRNAVRATAGKTLSFAFES
jgi:hypothetical protein